MTSFTLKSGINKGDRRMWMEGARLTDAGLTKGMKGSRHLDGDTVTIHFPARDGGRKCTISGKPARPVIDLSGAWVTAFIGDHPNFRTTIATDGDSIILTINPSK